MPFPAGGRRQRGWAATAPRELTQAGEPSNRWPGRPPPADKDRAAFNEPPEAARPVAGHAPQEGGGRGCRAGRGSEKFVRLPATRWKTVHEGERESSRSGPLRKKLKEAIDVSKVTISLKTPRLNHRGCSVNDTPSRGRQASTAPRDWGLRGLGSAMPPQNHKHVFIAQVEGAV